MIDFFLIDWPSITISAPLLGVLVLFGLFAAFTFGVLSAGSLVSKGGDE